MKIKIFGLTCRVELLVISVILGAFVGAHLLCSCAKVDNIKVGLKKVKESLGSEKKKLLKSEKVLHSILSRRLVARKNIPANSSLKMQDLKPVLVYASKGFQTNQLNKLLRKKVRKNVNKAHIFTSKDIKV